MNKIKSMMMVMIVLAMFPIQAMAASALIIPLPYGLEFGKPVPGKVKRVGHLSGETYSLNQGVLVVEVNGGFTEISFTERMPKAWSKLGLRVDKTQTPDQVKAILNREGVRDMAVDYFNDEHSRVRRFEPVVGPYEFHFFFNGGNLYGISVSEALTEDW